ncbi:MAG: L,D-transpeptidase [Solirubrobacterales bacterium]|nr:L,D-transpeptidase [Solirubrobacterales bacterium]
MGRRAVLTLAALVIALGTTAAAVLIHDRGPRASEPPAGTSAPADRGEPDARRSRSVRAPGSPPGVLPLTGPLGARLVRRTQLRTRPGGRVIRALGRRTGYGSPRVLAVVGQRDGHLAVLTHYRGNSRPGWIPARSARLLREPYAMRADLSERELVVRREGRVVRRLAITVGGGATPTPTGRFAVTDALRLTSAGGPYGCCALALTGRQPNVPQGWTGGDRLAIHGTSNPASVGTAASSGCLRAREADIRWLLKRIPLGARLTIVS